MTNHALGEQPCKRLTAVQIHIAAITECPHEEAGIQEMQHRMFNTADILVDWHPVIVFRLIKRLVILMGRGEPGEIPGAFEEGIERICFTRGRLAAAWAINVLPRWVPVERIA